MTVLIEGAGYEFGEAAAFLQNLEADLERANPGAVRELRARLDR